MKKKILLLTLIIMLVIPTIAFAGSFKYEAKLEQSGEPKVYKENDEINITLKISDINVGDFGMNTIEGILEYDEDLFEVVDSNNFKGKNGWSFAYNDSTTGQKGKFLGMVLSMGVNEEQEIATITLKVRNEVKKSATASNIVLKDVKTNDGDVFINGQDTTISVPLQVEYKGTNPVVVVIIIIAILAIVLGLFSILKKKSK